MRFFGWAFLAIALQCAPALAGVSVDSCDIDTASPGGITTYSYAGHTVGTLSSGALVARLYNIGATGPMSSVTGSWDGGSPQSMTLLGTSSDGSSRQVFWFGLRSPHAGLKSVTFNWTGSAQVTAAVCSFDGVDITNDSTAFKNFVCSPSGCTTTASTASSQSVTGTATANDAVLGAFTGVGTSYASTNQSNQLINNGGTQWAVAGNTAVGISNPTMTANFSGTFNTMSSAITIAAPAGAASFGGPPCPFVICAR